MERQKTAVEWLITEIEDLITIETFQKWKDIKEQALALEREQIVEAYKHGKLAIISKNNEAINALKKRASITFVETKTSSAEDYYNKKYGKQ